MANLHYCSNCGAQLGDRANFCPFCGKPLEKHNESAVQHIPQATVASPAPAPITWQQTQPYPTQEVVVGMISGAARRSGFMGLKYESFVIVLTNMRILFAAQTSAMMQDNVRRARDDAKQQGKGFFGQWGAQFQANSGREYMQKPPQLILAEQPTNFYINIDQLRSIRMWETDSGGEDSTTTYYMEFDTNGGKHKFSFNALNIRQLRRELQQYYGKIVR